MAEQQPTSTAGIVDAGDKPATPTQAAAVTGAEPERHTVTYEATAPNGNRVKRTVQSGLTLAGMRKVLANGGSFFWIDPATGDGRHVTRASDLPTEAQLATAAGDAGAIDAARAANDAEIERLRAENAALKDAAKAAAAPKPAAATAPVVPAAPPKK